MAYLTKLSFKKRRRGLIFAELLRCAASAAPDEELKADVLRLAGSVERRYGFSPEEKKEAVMAMILNGAQTRMDLVVETGFNPQDIAQIVKSLETEGRVKSERLSVHGTGRPSQIIKPVVVKVGSTTTFSP
jgi:hypothetical protein